MHNEELAKVHAKLQGKHNCGVVHVCSLPVNSLTDTSSSEQLAVVLRVFNAE